MSPQNLTDKQRAAYIQKLGMMARDLFQEGYAVEGNRVLDEIADCLRAWGEKPPEPEKPRLPF